MGSQSDPDRSPGRGSRRTWLKTPSMITWKPRSWHSLTNCFSQQVFSAGRSRWLAYRASTANVVATIAWRGSVQGKVVAVGPVVAAIAADDGPPGGSQACHELCWWSWSGSGPLPASASLIIDADVPVVHPHHAYVNPQHLRGHKIHFDVGLAGRQLPVPQKKLPSVDYLSPNPMVCGPDLPPASRRRITILRPRMPRRRASTRALEAGRETSSVR